MNIINNDCIVAMRELEEGSIDAIITDPPYGLEFMGKDWDSFDGWKTGAGFSQPGIGDRKTPWPSFTGCSDEFGGANPTCATCGGRARGKKKCCCAVPDWRVKGEKPDRMYGRIRQMRHYQDCMQLVFDAAIRVAKPGAHLLAFGGTRTFHRLACAIEDAGWEIRDCIMWVYGSGFPKSMDVSKAIDKAAGAEREVTAVRAKRGAFGGVAYAQDSWTMEQANKPLELPVTEPATDAAKQWQGWGTALKPAWEPIIVARKPLQGTVAQNVQEHGTGAINVDGCRVGTDGGTCRDGKADKPNDAGWENMRGHGIATLNAGRWPANLIHDGSEEVVGLFPQTTAKGHTPKSRGKGGLGCDGHEGQDDVDERWHDSGSAARFFYCSKASRSERGEGNNHPTVKPLALMQYLCRLVTPPRGVILDPFMGSGSTLVAAKLEGFSAIGIEQNQDYCAIAQQRLNDTPGTLF